DVYSHKIGETYTTVLNDDGLSKLRISQHYRNALKNGAASQTKEYIQDKLRSAVWLIRSIHQRQRTIVKVTDSIIKFQREFLDKGIAFLRPLILRDVAEDIGMHESTVSRVTTNKYVHTPQGIFELKTSTSLAAPSPSTGRCLAFCRPASVSGSSDIRVFAIRSRLVRRGLESRPEVLACRSTSPSGTCSPPTLCGTTSPRSSARW